MYATKGWILGPALEAYWTLVESVKKIHGEQAKNLFVFSVDGGGVIYVSTKERMHMNFFMHEFSHLFVCSSGEWQTVVRENESYDWMLFDPEKHKNKVFVAMRMKHSVKMTVASISQKPKQAPQEKMDRGDDDHSPKFFRKLMNPET